MGIREFAGQMKSEIEALRAKGMESIPAKVLINYLSQIEQSPESDPSPVQLESYKAALTHSHTARTEMFRSVITSGQNAIRSMVVINGGASVALLAFLGHLATINSSSIATFADCLVAFVAGTLLAGLVSGGTYLSQWLLASERPAGEKAGFWVNILVIALGIASYVAFGLGAYWTYDAFARPADVGLSRLIGL